jgi:hypothetical protein
MLQNAFSSRTSGISRAGYKAAYHGVTQSRPNRIEGRGEMRLGCGYDCVRPVRGAAVENHRFIGEDGRNRMALVGEVKDGNLIALPIVIVVDVIGENDADRRSFQRTEN